MFRASRRTLSSLAALALVAGAALIAAPAHAESPDPQVNFEPPVPAVVDTGSSLPLEETGDLPVEGTVVDDALAVSSPSRLLTEPTVDFSAGSPTIVRIDTPAAGGADDSWVHITGNVSAIAPTSYWFDAGAPSPVGLDGSGSFDFTGYVYGDGPHTLRIETATGEHSEVEFVVDNIVPVAVVTSPWHGKQVVPGDPLDFRGTVTDANLATWSLTLDGVVLRSGTGGSGVPIRVPSIDTTAWAKGEHVFVLAGVDRAGNVGQVWTAVWVEGPGLTVTSPAPGEVVSEGSFLFEGVISDDALNSWNSWAQRTSPSWSAANIGYGWSNGAFSSVIDTSGWPDGVYTIYVDVTSNRNGFSRLLIPIIVDHLVEGSEIVTPSDRETLRVDDAHVTGTLVSAAATMSYSLDDGPAVRLPAGAPASAEATERPFDFWLRGLSEGDHVISVFTTDDAAFRTFSVDVPEPPASPPPSTSGRTGSADPEPSETTEPTPDPSATEQPVEKTDDETDAGTDDGSAGGSVAAAGDTGESGFPIIWIVVGIVIVVLAGGGFLIRFIVARR